MNNYGKDQFDAIEIPTDLGKTVRRATHRGIAIRAAKKSGTFLCLLLMLTGLVANVPNLYAAAAEIPIFGQIVRIMHIGSGGTAGQAVCGYVFDNEETVSIRFTSPSGDTAEVPEFSVMQRDLPRRTVLHMHGIKQLEQDLLLEALLAHPAVSDAYYLVYEKDDEVGLNILTREDTQCIVSQYTDGILQIGFQPAAARKNVSYVLSSKPMEPGQELMDLYSSLTWEGASQIRREDGTYQIFLGEFATWEHAKNAQQGILNSRQIALEIQKISE